MLRKDLGGLTILEKTMKTFFCILMMSSMILGLCATTPQMASAQTRMEEDKPVVPAGLQQAFLAASAKPFSTQGGTYTSEYNGMDYRLNVEGLLAEGNGIQWGISLRGVGRGDEAQDVQPPEIVQTDERLEYRHGNLTEWYRDTVLGVEQGFTINESPQGNGKLVLHLDLSTDLEGQLNGDERGISFPGMDGRTLRYDNLKAYDANGVELEAKMVYNPAQVVIHVDDRDAEYPITVDPLIYLEQKVIALDGATSDGFGNPVAVSGDTALVGAVGDDGNKGSAYVFVHSGSYWTQQAKLIASDGAVSDRFGYSVAISGDTALVGAYYDDSLKGSAYIFVRSGTTWTQQAKLTANDGEAWDYFGDSVALSGDTALVGAYSDDSNKGSAYIFVKPGSGWTSMTQTAKLTASDGAYEDYFGNSVALSGDTALVGAHRDDSEKGAAYIFIMPGSGWITTSTYTAKLTASDGVASDLFGQSVALSGDTALVGAHWDDIYKGSAYIFVKPGSGWTTTSTYTAKLTASDGAGGDEFGYSVAISGDTALVGAHGDDDDGSASGSAYVFVKPGSGWTTTSTYTAKLTASDGAGSDYFGNSVALSGDTALVGAYLDDSQKGSAYFYQPYRSDADLGLSTVSGTGSPSYPGDTVLLSASVMNYGPASADNVTLSVSLPAGLTYVSHVATLGTFTPDTGSWNVGSLPLGVSATLTITATVDMTSSLSKTVTFSANTPIRDTNDTNNTANLTLTIAKKQLLKNGGFNTYTGTSKIPTYWVKSSTFASTDGKDTTSTNRKEGAASVKIKNTTAKTKTLSQTITVSGSAGNPFIFSYYVKGSTLPSAGTCQAQVLFYNSSTLTGTKTLACSSTGTFSYRKKTLSFTAPSAYTKIIVKFTYSKANSTVWFDLASLLR
jgi:uncharacterized repeat protein (TIGR01451 family)